MPRHVLARIDQAIRSASTPRPRGPDLEPPPHMIDALGGQSSPQDINIGQTMRNGVPLYTREVAALVHETCVRLEDADARGEGVGAPTADELWVTLDGQLRINPMHAGTANVERLVGLAALIEQLLPPFSNDPNYAVRASMRILPPRLRAKPGLSPLVSVTDLLQSIQTFETDAPDLVLEQLSARVGATEKSTAPAAVTEGLTEPLIPQTYEAPAATAAAAPESSTTGPSAPVPESSTTAPTAAVPRSSTKVPPAPVVPTRPPRVEAVTWASGPKDARRYVRSAALVVLGLGLGLAVARYAGVQSARTVRPHAGPPAPSAGALPRGAGNARAREPRTIGSTGTAGTMGTDVRMRPAPPSSSKVSAGKNAETQPSSEPAPPESPVAVEALSPSFETTGTAQFLQTSGGIGGGTRGSDTNAQGLPLQIVTVLVDGAKNYHPRLSPDERLIAFDSDRDGERGVYIAGRDGSQVHRVSGAGFAAMPTWSPDMKGLLFARAEEDRPQVWNLWLHDLSTGGLRRLTSYRTGQTWGASWFPDGRRICYSQADQLVVLDITTGSAERFRSPAGPRLRTPAVSPDGRRIVFQVDRDGVWLLDLQTRSFRRIVDDPTAEEFVWNPQGTRVAYHSRRTGEWRIWVTTAPS